MNFWKKRIKNTTSIANKLGVDEEKVKELKEGKREVNGETMNKVLNAINENKIEQIIENADIWKWYYDISTKDLINLRMKFGYKSQNQIAKKVNIPQGEYSKFENKKFEKVNIVVKKMYYFFNNDFNKIIEKEKINKKVNKLPKSIKKLTKEEENIWEWYINTDIRALRKNIGYNSIYDFAKKTGCSEASVSELELKKIKRICKVMTRAYNVLNAHEVVKETEEQIKISNNEIMLRDEVCRLEARNEELKEKIEQLELQLSRYEKLIDRL